MDIHCKQETIKVIPQYCTAHNKTQQNIMAAFLAGKLAREKNGRFERHGWEKEVKFVVKKEKTAERKF